ncbi:hypothetical protein [Dermatobacter hominis]|uniref:hypothetical protein n=1 Tax=Dermatobacter hominis TaxID=2884263 RepID=UPI001D114D95|nr:hypothetical protein [Dermatobacter hominis]UDY36249.1 hypothetical protein LH044_01640 [Dermatobacter hominis]
MSWTLLGLVVGTVIAAAIWSLSEGAFAVPALERTNYRGATLYTAIGVVIPVTVLLVVAIVRLVLAAEDAWYSWDQLSSTTLILVIGFALLGLLDDVAGVGQSGGFRSHVGALRRGRVTSGMIKLVGGGAVGVVAVSVMQSDTPFLAQDTGTILGLLRDGAIVALAANLGNLFDRAPGRATKFTAVAFVALALVVRDSILFMPAVAIGAGLGLLAPDLRERAMLGDAGANPLGAVCGLAALWAVPDPWARWLVLAVVLALNLLSEVVSFSTVIDSVGPLRWFDRLGSLRAHPVDGAQG